MPLNPSQDAQFEALARELAPSVRRKSVKAVKNALQRSPFDMDADLLPPEEDDEYESALFIRDFLSPGPGLAVDYGLVFQYAPKDLGAGQVSIVNHKGETGTFTRATTATTVDRSGKIVSVASGVARSYYDPTSLAFLGYLSEGARTNLILQSADFSTTWGVVDTTVSTNQTTSPDGTVAGDLATEGSAGTAVLTQGYTGTASTTQTVSIWLKRGNTDWVRVVNRNQSNNNNRIDAWFNLATGAVGTISNAGTATGGAATITAFPNGWYRCTVTGIPDVGVTTYGMFMCSATADASTTRVSGATYYVWGAQAEQATFASSYIPTTTASATRNADDLHFPASAGSQGTLVVEGRTLATDTAIDGLYHFVELSDGTTNNDLLVRRVNSAITAQYVLRVSNVVLVNLSDANVSQNVRQRYALAYAVNDFAGSVNGAAPKTDTSLTVPVCSTMYVGSGNASNQLFGPVAEVSLYSQRIPTAALTSMST